mgnify:CR=1 FL=1
MFAFKKKYFLIIESIKDLNLRNIKIHKKFNIIYRNFKKLENIDDIKKFRKQCKLKQIKFFIANNTKLAVTLNADGLYVSAFNKDLKSLHYKKSNFSIIGSAHNMKEIKLKILQGCNHILLSKLFKVDYDDKAAHLGIIKFNIFCNKMSKILVALGGIKIEKLNHLRHINCKSIAILSELKKKPANIVNRLF